MKRTEKTRDRRTNAHVPRRDGFVLIAILGAIVAAVALGALAHRAARVALQASGNRAAFLRARWHADACVERSRGALAEGEWNTGPAVWTSLDASLPATRLVRLEPLCTISLRAVGDRIDVNRADGPTLRRLFVGMGVTPTDADSLVDAVLDWRDADDEVRQRGAEASWYQTKGLPVPRNGALASIEELGRVRGFSPLGRFVGVLDVEPGRVSLTRAHPAVLAALPGFTPELVDRVLERRTHGTVTADLNELTVSLSPDARAALVLDIPNLQPLVTVEPEAWLITSRGRTYGSPVGAVVEAKLVRGGPGGVVVRRREVWE